MSIPGSGSPLLLASTAAAAAAEYVIPKSLRFNDGDSAYLSKTFSTAGNQQTWTWSAWIKRASFGINTRLFDAYSAQTDTGWILLGFNTSDQLFITGWSTVWKVTSQVFRDPSAFFHLVVAFDVTESTGSDRIKFYINGTQVTAFATDNSPAQNTNHAVNGATTHEIGRYSQGQNQYFDGLMADIQFVDGQALAATDFGETRSSDGVWVPKEYTFGTNPNNGTTWSSTYSAAFAGNAMTDSATVGSLTGVNSSITITLAESVTVASSLELNLYANVGSFSTYTTVSINGTSQTANMSLVNSTGSNSGVWKVTGFTGTLTSITLGAQGGANNGISRVIVDGFTLLNGARDNSFHLNFSDSSTIEALGFDSAPTTPDPDPKKGMDVITYTGNGGTQNIGGLNFEPGLIWIKVRDQPGDHKLIDSVRGASKRLESNTTDAEETATTGITSFNPDGFSLGSSGTVNGNNYSLVAWTWRAGGPAVAKTSGTIDAEVSANTDYGFSICKFTGTGTAGTIEHGLSTVPKWYIVKNLDTSPSEWNVFHVSTGETKRLKLNSNSAAQTAANSWNDTAPTASLFTVGTDTDVNKSGDEHIAYVWSEVSGYSKFSSYSGTGSTHTVDCGFRPAFLIMKSSTGSYNWQIKDNQRGDKVMFADTNAADTSDGVFDFTDNGFTVTGSGNATNASGQTYIFAAFADRPGNNWDVNNIVTNEGLTTSKTQFDVVTYTGNGGTQSIDSLAFQPDFVWIKLRTSTANHSLFDSVRGAPIGSHSNLTNAEFNDSSTLTAFNSDGFTLAGHSVTNDNNQDYVAWCWKAGGTAVSNTNGSITSSVSANAAYGFSVVTYTGTGSNATVGHGLNKVPGLIIIKRRNGSGSWGVYHSALGATQYVRLNRTEAAASSVGYFNDTEPTTSVFSIGTTATINSGSGTYVAYCFANIPGYQRIGSYTGNGSSTGPVVVTGFKPRFLLIKGNNTSGWIMYDSERDSVNPNNYRLQANSSGAESTGDANTNIDFLDNGFQLKNSDSDSNGSGVTYVYLAIGDDEIGSDEDCLVDVPNAVTADADATDTTGGYQRGNYATFNPIEDAAGGGNASLSNGNLQIDGSSSEQFRAATIAVSSGKWYFEIVQSAGTDFGPGVWAYPLASPSSQFYQNENYRYNSNGGVYDESAKITDYSSFAVGDVIGTALDMDNGKVYFSKNGVWQNNGDPSGTNPAASGLTGQWIFGASTNGNSTVLNANFGQQRFKYPIPSGYAALNTTALPAATIEDGSDYFDAVLYTGNGSTKTVSGLEFSPDWIWFKQRNTTRENHLYDSVRGVQKAIYTDLTNAEATDTDALSSFNSDGWTMGADGGSNQNNGTYVAWCWDAGSSTVSNTDGSITSSVRANQTAGFSIVAYSGNSTSGATIGHGLNAAPEFVVVKARNIGTQGWCVYHASLGATKYIQMDTTNAASTYSGTWNNTSPTNSVFTVGNDNIVNTGYNYVAYCFTPVAGYSAFGSYEGNSNADGPFIYTGFRPRWIMYKWADGGGEWAIRDTARSTYNVSDQVLTADSSGAEQENAVWNVDILSNGFKIRTSSAGSNSSSTFIYAVFAENPFQANGGLAR